MKSLYCFDCGKKKDRKGKYCRKCFEKHGVKALKKAYKEQREVRKIYLDNEVRLCKICKDVEVGLRVQYCPSCAKLIALKRQYERNKKQQDAWKSLDEKEKLRRMNIIAKKLLEEEDESEKR